MLQIAIAYLHAKIGADTAENDRNFAENLLNFATVAKSSFAEFQKFQVDNSVDFENCCKTRIFLQRSASIQPKTTEILPKFGNYPTGPLSRGTRRPPRSQRVLGPHRRRRRQHCQHGNVAMHQQTSVCLDMDKCGYM